MQSQELFEQQRAYIRSGQTHTVQFRKEALKKLRRAVVSHVDELVEAFRLDFNKAEFDVYATEVGIVIREIDYFLGHLGRLARPKRVPPGLINLPAKARIVSLPRGVVLIMAPWNYPFQLVMVPLIGAIAAGNCAFVKPSSKTPNICKVIEDILSIFPKEYIYVNSARDATLFDLPFDLLFYTGSTAFAREIQAKMAQHLTPAVLELGGKSPCIVDSDADLEVAARRIVWGKFLNAGQTCVAPDYCIVHRSVKTRFTELVLEQVRHFYYEGDRLRADFPYVISERKVQEVLALLEGTQVLCGGVAEGRQMAPTVVTDVDFESPLMQEEIFAPVLPILEFDDLQSLLAKIEAMDHPLAFYYFSRSQRKGRHVMMRTLSGGACINDTIMHLSEEQLPFGGVGASGFGSYHGRRSFETFSHQKSVLIKGRWEMKVKYPPQPAWALGFLKRYFDIR